MDQFKTYEDAIDKSHGQGDSVSPSTVGPENWSLQVLNQQPRHLSALLQKLHSSDSVHEVITQECKEQHRQIEDESYESMGDIPHLLDVMCSWISPSEDEENILVEQMRDAFREKIMTVGDLILHIKGHDGIHVVKLIHLRISWMRYGVIPLKCVPSVERMAYLPCEEWYAIFLFSKHHEEVVGIYASQLAHHRCIDHFVHMELRLNSSVHVKYKIFVSAIENLPFSAGDDSKGIFEEIFERVLSRSREIKPRKYDKSSDEKAMVIQWLCFTFPSTVNDAQASSAKLLLRALLHSNILFREYALISMWRVPAMPIGAHTLLSFLAEPLKQPTETLLSAEDHGVSENLREFQNWSEYYSCDATYRNWLKVELENVEVSPLELSVEEKAKSDCSRKENPWLVPTEDHVYESVDCLFLELHATVMLCLPSVSKEVVLNRQLMVSLSHQIDNYCIEVVLRCLATDGDGLGPHELNDGVILATVIAAGFKDWVKSNTRHPTGITGSCLTSYVLSYMAFSKWRCKHNAKPGRELVRFQAGVTMEISRLDAWYSSKDCSLEGRATYIMWGLCRRCCIPEVILRCMQEICFCFACGASNPPESHDELIELVA
ncbi:unnamed protein product [Camellia sinensis]